MIITSTIDLNFKYSNTYSNIVNITNIVIFTANTLNFKVLAVDT